MTDPAPSSRAVERTVALVVDGHEVEVHDTGITLLDALRDHLGVRSAKDGCSPQGQCGCCTVLVDGAPRVACVTPLRRVAGRTITTVDGLEPGVRTAWADAFAATGASQCGFCTPGIICRLEGARTKGVAADDDAAVGRALAAHLCRCTGWRPIYDAWALVAGAAPEALETPVAAPAPPPGRSALRRGLAGPTAEAGRRDRDAAARRATLEGHAPQTVGPEVALGHGGFADDLAPTDALVAVPDGRGGWEVGETLAEARARAGKVQGRRTTVDPVPPLALPDVDGAVAALRSGWVEPAYLEPDAAWCRPGGEPVGPLTNGGAFGAKRSSPVASAARTLADRHGRPVRVLLAREDVARLGPKRPPVAGAVRADGSGVLRVVATHGVADEVARVAPGLVVEEVEVAGPPTEVGLRAVGWAEAEMLLAAARGPAPVAGPGGGSAEATIAADGTIRIRVAAGDPLDEVVLRSYCTGAAHQALSWVRSEGLAVTADGVVEDLTVRSFGIVRAADMPPVEVDLDPAGGEPVNGSDAVFVAVAVAAWLADGAPPDLPTRG